MTNPVSAEEAADVVERLNREARYCEQGNSYGRDVLAPLMRNAAEFLEALTSPPAPSGWQPIERNAALLSLTTIAKYLREIRHPATAEEVDRCVTVLSPTPGQNAKDALPEDDARLRVELAESQKWHMHWRERCWKTQQAVVLLEQAMRALVADWREGANRHQQNGNQLLADVLDHHADEIENALPPAPEASPATRSVQDDLLDAMECLSKRDDMSAAYRRDVPILIGALRLARERAVHGDENEKPWHFCPWCGVLTWMHAGDPTMNCGRQADATVKGDAMTSITTTALDAHLQDMLRLARQIDESRELFNAEMARMAVDEALSSSTSSETEAGKDT